MPMINRRSILAWGGALATSGPSGTRAATFPERPVTVIVPYAAGSTGDVVTRLLSQDWERQLGQNLIIEARPGAGGNVGAHAVASADPTGHVLLLGATNNFVINQFLFKKMSFDPLDALVPITKVADVPSVLYVHPSVPARNFKELVAYARRNGGRLNYGSPSIGTTPHLEVERLKRLVGLDFVHVPYRGSTQIMQALVTNEIQLFLGGLSAGKTYLESGALRAIAVATSSRMPALPDVPTIAESGLPGYSAANWWALAAPKGTPPSVLDRLHVSVSAALQNPTVRQRYAELGLDPGGGSAQALADEMRAAAALWSEAIKQIGLSID